MALEKWRIINSEIAFEHRWYKLRKDIVELPAGRIVDDYFVSVRPDVVIVFAVTAKNEVILVRQYKHGTADIVDELPGGVIDENENPEEAVKRELLEETGYTADSFELINILIDNPTKDTNKINLYVAKNAKKIAEQDLDENEQIEVYSLPVAELKDKLIKGEIKVSGSVAGIFLALNHLGV